MNATQAYAALLSGILFRGSPAVSGGRAHVELLGNTSFIYIRDPVVRNIGRRPSYQFMLDEARWILGGYSTVDFSPTIKKNWGPYSDYGQTLTGAYGPKYVGQRDYVIDTLDRDRGSRQAVMTIWRERPLPSKNIPCTVSLQWLIRDNKIHCVANMRSSDAWLGWPYDVFCFSMMTWHIRLGLRYRDLLPGTLAMMMGSSHLYREDIAGAESVISNDLPAAVNFPYEQAKTPLDLLTMLEERSCLNV